MQLITKSKHGLLVSSQITQPHRSGGPLDCSQISAVSRSHFFTRATRRGINSYLRCRPTHSSLRARNVGGGMAYQVAEKEIKSKREADMIFYLLKIGMLVLQLMANFLSYRWSPLLRGLCSQAVPAVATVQGRLLQVLFWTRNTCHWKLENRLKNLLRFLTFKVTHELESCGRWN